MAAGDVAALVALARAQAVDLVVVGPEDPLVAGLADRLREAGIAVFGPSAAAARLEGSKSFAKAFMQRHRIPTAGFAVFDDLDAARAYARRQAGGCVVKADGLAAGKGVAVCDTPEQALAALDEAMRERRFGAAGDRVVIEERLVGEEASYYAITDGEHVVALAAAQDHKRIGDGDRGENTGGMGAYAPAPIVDAGGREEGARADRVPRDPRPRGRGDALPRRAVRRADDRRGGRSARDRVQRAVRRSGDAAARDADGERSRAAARRRRARRARARGAAGESRLRGVRGAGLRGVSARGRRSAGRIAGLDAAARDPDVVVFHAGTRRQADGSFVTAGGRVLGVTARGDSVAAARERAYRAVAQITFEGCQFRRDIAAQVRAASRRRAKTIGQRR